MKKIRFFAIILLLAGVLLEGAEARQPTLADMVEESTVEDAAQPYLSESGFALGDGLDQGLSAVFQQGSLQFDGILRQALKSGIALLMIVLLYGLAESVSACGALGLEIDAVSLAGALAVAAAAVSDIHGLIGLGREMLSDIGIFSQALLPAVTAAAAAAGAPASAVARQVATLLFSDLLLLLINYLLIPLVYAYIALVTAHAAIGNEGLRRIAGTLKSVVSTTLTGVLIAFVGYLSISGVIAGTSDAVTVRATKFTMSSMVPVVGGILSDAAETILAGAGIVRNTLGLFGMIVVLLICVGPFLRLGVHYLTYKLTAALAATLSQGRVIGLIDQIGGAFGLVLGMTGASALILLISIASGLTVVAA